MLAVGDMLSVGITHCRDSSHGAHLNMVARGMNPFRVCRAPPSRGGPETANVVAQLFKWSKKDVILTKLQQR